MTEERTETSAGVEYSEAFIGDCSRGCGRPATTRIHGDWVACALHHHEHEITERINEASLAREILKPWQSEAEFHGCFNLVASLDRAAQDEGVRLSEAKEDLNALRRIDHESAPNHDVREAMGKKHLELVEEEADGEDSFPGTKEEREHWDAKAEAETWEHARLFLAPWVEASRHVGNPDLTGVVGEALGRVDENLARARRRLERAEGALEKEG